MVRVSRSLTGCLIGLLTVLLSMQAAVGQEGQIPVHLSLPHIAADPGEVLVVPIEIGDVTGLEIVSADFLITYDARLVKAERVLASGTFTQGWAQASRVGFVEDSQDTVGLIDVAMATANQIPSGAGTFFKIEFRVLDTAEDGQITPLVMKEAILNNRNPKTVTQDGSIRVGEPVEPGLLVEESKISTEIPEVYALHPNVPNPFNAQTEIRYDLPEAGSVSLVIYNSMGQVVQTMVSGYREAGRYRAVWDGKDGLGYDVASGVYVLKLRAGTFGKNWKMLLLR